MSVDLYWAGRNPYCWRALLGLALKRQPYTSHCLQPDLQEHKAPHMLAMNPRGRLPIVKVDGYVVFESLAILYYLDQKFPQPALFGHSPEEAGVILRVINEFQAYTEAEVDRLLRELKTSRAPSLDERLTDSMYVMAGEARTIENRLSKGDWIVGDAISAADLYIYPCIRLVHRALLQPAAKELSARFLPLEVNYPGLARWLNRIESMPEFKTIIAAELT